MCHTNTQTTHTCEATIASLILPMAVDVPVPTTTALQRPDVMWVPCKHTQPRHSDSIAPTTSGPHKLDTIQQAEFQTISSLEKLQAALNTPARSPPHTPTPTHTHTLSFLPGHTLTLTHIHTYTHVQTLTPTHREQYVDFVLVNRLGVVHSLHVLLNTVALTRQDGLIEREGASEGGRKEEGRREGNDGGSVTTTTASSQVSCKHEASQHRHEPQQAGLQCALHVRTAHTNHSCNNHTATQVTLL